MANVMSIPALRDYEVWAGRSLEKYRQDRAGNREISADLPRYLEAVREECAREVERWGADPDVIRRLQLVSFPSSFGAGQRLSDAELEDVLARLYRDVRTRQIREAVKRAGEEAHWAYQREDNTQVTRWRDAEAALRELLAKAELRPDVEPGEWLRAVSALENQVASWAEQHGWRVATGRLQRSEEVLGTYEMPMLTIETQHGTIILEPIGRVIMGADGRVDLYAYPSHYRVRLLRDRDTGKWRIRTDSGVFLRQEWDEQTFLDLVQDLTAAS